MSLVKTVTEGGQIWAHRIRMTKQVIRIAFMLSGVVASCYFALLMSRVPVCRYQSIGYYVKSPVCWWP